MAGSLGVYNIVIRYALIIPTLIPNQEKYFLRTGLKNNIRSFISGISFNPKSVNYAKSTRILPREYYFLQKEIK
ncbi:hypothetical protein [Pedobacter westerhofensis]|uniref:hypothetical protein n=1 Tax=Pedobacter westerhofensis TaxID=425512 RepID=UPI001157ACC4|nr:hypothetical protein [Pedobacter westerhofensis]